MADEPENLILKLLREIRGKLDEHDRRFDSVEGRLDRLDKKIDDWGESTAMALGLASHANIRSNSIEEQLNDLKKRVEALERVR